MDVKLTHVNAISKVSGGTYVTTTVEKEVFVRLEDGTEFSKKFEDDLLIREGHKVTLKKVFFTESKFIWAYLLNQSNQQKNYFNLYQIARDVTKKTYLSKNKFVSLEDYRYDPGYVKDSKEISEKLKQGC